MKHVSARSPSMSRSVAGAVGAALLLASGAAHAQPAPAPAPAKTPPVVRACGVSAIPLVVGNEWTYEPVLVPTDSQLTEAQIKLTPLQPKKVVIKVTSVDTKDSVTTVGLIEDLDGKAHDTSITCTAGGARFQISMDSFWFAGEAGPPIGVELGPLERKGQTLTLVGGKITVPAGVDWHDDIKTTWKHATTGKATPAMHGGTLNLMRHWVVQPDDAVATKLATYARTKKLGLETTIELTIDPPPSEPLKPPALLVNFFWFADGVGPVQVLNSYGQMFQLNAATLAASK